MYKRSIDTASSHIMLYGQFWSEINLSVSYHYVVNIAQHSVMIHEGRLMPEANSCEVH